MQFPTAIFLIFFLFSFSIIWLSNPWNELRKAILVVLSFVFYAWWNINYIFLLSFIALFSYFVGNLIFLIEKKLYKKIILIVSISINILLLGFFKYLTFFTELINQGLDYLSYKSTIPYLEITLPVGISFMTFHGISYVMDVYKNKIQATKNPIDLLLYVAFFPQLVAGPIVRASVFLPQFKKSPDPNQIYINKGLILIILGLFKKVVLASALANDIVDPVFLSPESYHAIDLILAIYGYSAQIYCDFSGYSDIAIGLALLLGYHFPINFNQPYRATSPSDFWQRWHISLSSWLRDYLYISLGGNRQGLLRTNLNKMITMFLGGLWHGARDTFIVWGIMHGFLLIVQDFIKKIIPKTLIDTKLFRILGIFLTFNLVCLAWVPFRCASFADMLTYWTSLANWNQEIQYSTPFIFTLLTVSFSFHYLPSSLFEKSVRLLDCMPLIQRGVLAGFLVMIIDALGPTGIAPFIYFQF